MLAMLGLILVGGGWAMHPELFGAALPAVFTTGPPFGISSP